MLSNTARSGVPRRRAGALGATLLGLLVASLIGAGSASAVSFTNGATILGSGCTSQSTPMSWWGGYPYTGVFPTTYPRGRVYVCWSKHRINDADPAGDYYALTATSNWTFSSGGRNYPAAMNQSIRSNVAARDNVYSATQSFTSNRSCTEYITLSFGAGPVSASVTPRVCSGYTVTRRSYSGSGASWDSRSAGGLNRVETTFVQKVANGVVPRFDVSFGIPQYSNTWTGLHWSSTARLVYQPFTGR